MVEWWDGLSMVSKVLYCIAVPATLILVIQTILSLMGGFEGGSGLDVSDTSGLDFHGGSDISEIADADIGGPDFSGDGGNPADFSIMSMLTLQGIVTFLTVMGWSAIVSVGTGTPTSISIIVGAALGFIAMYGVARLMHASKKLTESGTLDFRNAIGETGRVYLSIPESGHGEGKISIQLQGSLLECNAISTVDKVIQTGTLVRVIDVRNDILVVEEEY